MEIYANLGQWFIEELNIKDTNSDPTMLTFQLGSKIKPTQPKKVVKAESRENKLTIIPSKTSATIAKSRQLVQKHANRNATL